MIPIRFHPDAASEMMAAASWYEAQQEGLGRRFLTTTQDALNRISVNPRLYPILDDEVRRCLTHTFPFGVLYQMTNNSIVILAVMHLHRDPDYWKKRTIEL